MLINCGGIYDPERLETVLRVTFPRIGDHERRLGTVSPGKSTGRFKTKVTQRSTTKMKGWQKGKSFKVHEVELDSPAVPEEEVQEPTPEEEEESVVESCAEEEFTVLNEDEGSDPPVGDDQEPAQEEGSEDESSVDESAQVAQLFAAGWKAEKQVNEKKKRRGFEPRDRAKREGERENHRTPGKPIRDVKIVNN